MKLLIFGKGQLGQAYKDYFEKNTDYQIVQAENVDIRQLDAVKASIDQVRPDIVLNVAAKTNIDWCEVHRTECFEVNTLGADNIGKVCQQQNIYLVHISSGCIQESLAADQIHLESDIPNPRCFYAWTKVWADQLLTDRSLARGIATDDGVALKVLILRPRQLLSSQLSPRNALAKMLTYNKFIDTPNSATIVPDLLSVTDQLIKKEAVGIFNVANPGIISPYKTALILKEMVKPEMAFEKIEKSTLDKMTLAKRIDSVLSVDKLKSVGIELKDIETRLRELIEEFNAQLQTEEGKKIMETVEAETNAKLKK